MLAGITGTTYVCTIMRPKYRAYHAHHENKRKRCTAQPRRQNEGYRWMFDVGCWMQPSSVTGRDALIVVAVVVAVVVSSRGCTQRSAMMILCPVPV